MPEENEDFEKIFGAGGVGGGEAAEDEFITFDPSEAGPGRMPKDDYFAAVAEPPVQQISSKGNPMMTVAFLVTDGPYKGSMQWRRYMLSGRAGGWTKEFLEAIGLKEAAAGTMPIVPKLVEGRRCIISVRDQKDNPDFQEVWRVRPHPDGPLPSADGPMGDSPF